MYISAIILAAGASSRMGKPKALLKWKGKSFLENICANLDKAGVKNIVVVTNSSINAWPSTNKTCPALAGINWVINPNPELGMLSSFRCGIRKLGSAKHNIMLCLTDHPAVKVETYVKLRENSHKNKIIIPVYKNHRGHPVIFGADFIHELLENECPQGARTVVHSHSNAVNEIPVDDNGILLDIDTPEDYDKLK